MRKCNVMKIVKHYPKSAEFLWYVGIISQTRCRELYRINVHQMQCLSLALVGLAGLETPSTCRTCSRHSGRRGTRACWAGNSCTVCGSGRPASRKRSYRMPGGRWSPETDCTRELGAAAGANRAGQFRQRTQSKNNSGLNRL